MSFSRGIPAVLFLLLWCAQAAQPGEVHDLVWAEDISGLAAYIEKHPDQVNAPDEDGLSPLHIAAMQGETEVVQALADLGADLCVKGVVYAVDRLKPSVIVPMHGGDSGYVYRQFADDHAKKVPAGTRFGCVENAGDRFAFRNGGLPRSRDL
ncbi:MAG: ankyrin repeat domain-containing protein [Planctomycetota bacterium]